ncbi:MAG: carbohydrate ABC transporter permease, partial [Candidatus Omnitrophica bacterium]|nr:carbohydrate ABC transporter permease [Candidatus Omnitrophota bacterium]
MVYYRTKKIITLIILHAFLMSVALSCVFPFIWMVNTSLETNAEFDSDYGLKPPSTFNLENYKKVIIESEFWRYFLNSVLYTFITVVLIVLIASLAAYSFSRLRFPGKNIIFYMFLAAMMIPLPAGFVPVYVLLQQFGLLNKTGYVLAMSNMGLSISIYLLKTFFDQLPRDLEDAARIDGCNKLQIWWNVGLPLITPALGVVVIFNALNVWNEFVLASIIFVEKKHMPLQAALMQFSGEQVTNHVLVMTALTVTALPIIILYILMQKQFVKGITAGAMVG